MLDQGDEHGLDLLEAAMSLDQDCIIPACEVASQYLIGAGREAKPNPT